MEGSGGSTNGYFFAWGATQAPLHIPFEDQPEYPETLLAEVPPAMPGVRVPVDACPAISHRLLWRTQGRCLALPAAFRKFPDAWLKLTGGGSSVWLSIWME